MVVGTRRPIYYIALFSVVASPTRFARHVTPCHRRSTGRGFTPKPRKINQHGFWAAAAAGRTRHGNDVDGVMHTDDDSVLVG